MEYFVVATLSHNSHTFSLLKSMQTSIFSGFTPDGYRVPSLRKYSY